MQRLPPVDVAYDGSVVAVGIYAVVVVGHFGAIGWPWPDALNMRGCEGRPHSELVFAAIDGVVAVVAVGAVEVGSIGMA